MTIKQQQKFGIEISKPLLQKRPYCEDAVFRPWPVASDRCACRETLKQAVSGSPRLATVRVLWPDLRAFQWMLTISHHLHHPVRAPESFATRHSAPAPLQPACWAAWGGVRSCSLHVNNRDLKTNRVGGHKQCVMSLVLPGREAHHYADKHCAALSNRLRGLADTWHFVNSDTPEHAQTSRHVMKGYAKHCLNCSFCANCSQEYCCQQISAKIHIRKRIKCWDSQILASVFRGASR